VRGGAPALVRTKSIDLARERVSFARQLSGRAGIQGPVKCTRQKNVLVCQAKPMIEGSGSSLAGQCGVTSPITDALGAAADQTRGVPAILFRVVGGRGSPRVRIPAQGHRHVVGRKADDLLLSQVDRFGGSASIVQTLGVRAVSSLKGGNPGDVIFSGV